MIADFVNQNIWPLTAALMLALLVLGMLLHLTWRWSARRTERRVHMQDEHGYGPAGKERVAELQSQTAILDSKINRLKSDLAARNAQLAQAEVEAAALHAERNEARLDNQRLSDAVNYWQARSENAETRIQEARLHYINLQNQARALAAALDDAPDMSSTQEDDLTSAARSTPETAMSIDAMQNEEPSNGQMTEETSASKAFVIGERPAPDHLPEHAPGPIIRKHSGPATNGFTKLAQDEADTDDSGPPKAIDMDELARRIRALEAGV